MIYTISEKSLTNKNQDMKTIAIYHNKGGVGKTTTVINLAAAFRHCGKRVLVIDLDSQANTTYAAGLVKFYNENDDNIKSSYIFHVISEKSKFYIPDVVRQSSFPAHNFDVIPSHIELMEHERELVEITPALTRLDKKLKAVQENYDLVLIDTPPSLNLYARIALIAANYLIIPSDLKPFANEGLRNVRKFIDDINEFREEIDKPPIKVLGVLPSKIPTAHKFVKYILPQMENAVKEVYGFPLLESKIFERRDVSAAIEQTMSIGDLIIPDPQSVFDYKPASQATEEFRQLAQEVMNMMEINGDK